MRPSTKRRRTKPCRESPGRPAACPSSSRVFSPSWSHATNAVPILAHGPHPPAHCCHRALALSRGTLACALSVGTLFSLASCHVAGIKIFAKNACDRDPGRAGVLVCTTANHRTGRTGWIGRLKQRLRLPLVPEAGGLSSESAALSLGLQMAVFSLCPHVVSLCMRVPAFLISEGHQPWWTRAHPMTPFDLSHLFKDPVAF